MPGFEFILVDSWNVKGKSMEFLKEWLHVVDTGVEVLALQEVGGTGLLRPISEESDPTLGGLTEFVFEDGDFRDYFVIGSSCLRSHLAQMILLSRRTAECLIQAYKGEWVIGAEYLQSGTRQKRWVFTVHLPHSNSPDEIFDECIRDIGVFARKVQSQHAIFIGDFNADPSSPRAILLDDALAVYGFRPVRSGCPTRFGNLSSTELDYAYVSGPLSRRISTSPDALLLNVNSESRLEIASDHDRVTLQVKLSDRLVRKRHRKTKRGNCGRWSVGPKLGQCLDDLRPEFPSLPLERQWEVLKEIQSKCCFRTPSLKYKDSPDLKQLCRDRSMCQDRSRKLELTRLIIARRRSEKLHWLQDLEAKASDGDPGAIRYLRSRSKPQGTMTGLIKEANGTTHAAAQLRDHFQELFSPQTSQADAAQVHDIVESLQYSSGLVQMTGFSEEEVSSAISRLKMGKTSGISGISNELLQSMWSLPQGKAVLLAFFNKMLESPKHPSDMHHSFVTLLPKVKNAMQASEVRPIHLIETANKLYCFLLLSRLYPNWPVPNCQFGAIRGGQVMDAMAAAQWQVMTESFQGTSGIWVNADIKSAFDTVNHAALAKFVFSNCPDHLCREALQLLRIALHPQLVFECLGEQWTTEQKQGIQQGHTYSAIVFSYLIGNIVHSQFSAWQDAGYCSDIGEWGWLFVDDLILRFQDWHTAVHLLPEMQHALALVGLHFNLRKTQLFAAEDTLRQGRLLDLSPDHVLSKIPWGSDTVYLRKPLRHLHTGESLYDLLGPVMKRAVHQGLGGIRPLLKGMRWGDPDLALRMINKYVGAKWFWMAPLMVPILSHVKDMLVLQVTILVTIMHLFIPDSCKHDAALSLQRLRRRAVSIFLSSKVHASWATIWRLRSWGYAGHLLRKPPEHATRRILLSFGSKTRPQGGYPNTPLKWLQQTASAAYAQTAVSEESLIAFAARRDVWRAKGQQLFRYMAESESHPIAHCHTWPHWKYSLLQQVPWLFACSLCVTADSTCHLSWIDEEHGVLTWALRQSLLAEDVHFLISHLRMQSQPFAVLLSLETWLFEAHLKDWHDLHTRVLTDFRIVLMYDTVQSGRMQDIMSCVFG